MLVAVWQHGTCDYRTSIIFVRPLVRLRGAQIVDYDECFANLKQC